MDGTGLTLALMVASTAGAVLSMVAFTLAGRLVAGPRRTTERRLDRAWAVLEADRARLLALLLASRPGQAGLDAETVRTVQATTPAYPPPPDVSLAGDEAAGGGLDVEYAADPHELDELDERALDLARR